MMGHPLDVPAFLRIPQDVRRAAWKGRKLTKQGSAFKPAPTRQEEAATRALRRQIEQEQEQKKAERFAALKELNMAKKTSRKTTVTSRLKSKPGRAPTALKKPRPERKPRGQAKPKAAPKPKAATPQDPATPKVSKREALRTFLAHPGKTLAEITTHFGWLPHSARAAIAGVHAETPLTKDKNGDGDIVYSMPATA